MRTVAAENVRRGITANAVLPGMVATEKVGAMPAEILDRLRRCDPDRAGWPSRARSRRLVAYLASEEAGYVTGQAIGIDGGAPLNAFSLTRRQR